MEIREISHRSADYEEMVDLRTRILRKPLGLEFSSDQLDKESADYLIGAFNNGLLVGCCILSPVSQTLIQLRQMAVEESNRKQGVGEKIIYFAESLAITHGFTTLILHARIPAVGFYERLGYRSVGPEFIELGISHLEMQKPLS